MRRLAALAAGQLSCYLRKIHREALLESYAGLLPIDVTEEELSELTEGFFREIAGDGSEARDSSAGTSANGFVAADGEAAIDDDFPGREALRQLFLLLKPIDLAGRIAWTVLELSVLYYMERQAGEVFGQICIGTEKGVTVELAARLVCGEREVLDYFLEVREAYRRVELLLLAEYPARNFMTAVLRADDRLVDWLSGGEDLTLLSPNFLAWYEPERHRERAGSASMSERQESATGRQSVGVQPEPIFREKVLEDAAVRYSGLLKLSGSQGPGGTGEPKSPIIAFIGENYSGRRFLAKCFADRFGFRLLMADAAFLGNLDNVLVQLRKLLREMLFSGAALCVTGVPRRADTVSMLRIMAEEYSGVIRCAEKAGVGMSSAFRPLLVTAEKDLKLVSMLDFPVVAAETGICGARESADVWDYFSEKYLGGRVLQSRELAVKMKLPVGRIEQAVKRLAGAPEADPYDSRNVFRYCYELLDDGRYDNIKRVETKYTYDDLKLEESQKSIIRDICAQVEHRRKVFDDWNLGSRYSYGTCVSALFTGPPGTGKTMAVHVMAGILGLELFKVDLSQLVDKYIGETEKRLEEVFRKAEQSNMILFFDEADSIIGKRSEVKEAKDKYANTEVSYLLQRMEEFDGIVILSSNYSQNIDAAFMRRIRFTIHFPIPDEATRKEIWKSAFAKEIPQEDIDFDYLARQFEFAGGQIKNVVLNAVFFAAAEDTAVEMRHLIRAIWLDLTKDKKVSFQEVLGEYAHLL